MPLWPLRSRTLGFRIRAAGVAALLVLLMVSLLASGDPAPPFAGTGPGAPNQPGHTGPRGSEPGVDTPDEHSVLVGATGELDGVNDTTALIDSSNEGDGLALWNNGVSGTPGNALGELATDDAPAFGIGNAAPGTGGSDTPASDGGGKIGWPLDGFPSGLDGSDIIPVQGTVNDPGKTDCVATGGSIGECVVPQLGDGTSQDPTAPRMLTSRQARVPEPATWLLIAVAFVVAAVLRRRATGRRATPSLVASGQRALRAPVR